ncbi:MAG: ABC transporter permease subunit [Desulfarculaceae bacterium]|nr:ABC transporter permease subunit [Desulfarculaceae bacterium]
MFRAGPAQGRWAVGWGGALLLTMLAAAMLAPWLAPHDPLATDLVRRLQEPSWHYPLGTDQLGRCVFSRLLWGGRLSLGAALAASLLALAWGACLGLAAGLGGRRADACLNLFIDAALALPGLMLALVLTGMLGPSLPSLVLGLAGASWAWWARLVRSLALGAAHKEYVLAGRAVGVRGTRLLTRYIFPQLREPVLAAAALKTGWIILAISGLSYLGLGAQPPAPEWGGMLQESRLYLTQAPWLMLAPGAAITLTVAACTLLGEGLQQTGGPRLREY